MPARRLAGSAGPSLRGRQAACREAPHLPGRWRPHGVPSEQEVAQPCRHIVSPTQCHVYLGQEGGYPAGLSRKGLPPCSCLPSHGVYPRFAVLVTCPSTRVLASVLLIAGSRERRLCRLHEPQGPWWLYRLCSTPPCRTDQDNSPHAARCLLDTRVTLLPWHSLLVGLILRHWAVAWLSCSALPSLHSMSGPHSTGTSLSPPSSRWHSLSGLSLVLFPIVGLFTHPQALRSCPMPLTV